MCLKVDWNAPMRRRTLHCRCPPHAASLKRLLERNPGLVERAALAIARAAYDWASWSFPWIDSEVLALYAVRVILQTPKAAGSSLPPSSTRPSPGSTTK